MSLYQINQLAQLSGIKAHTIRIWEKRYNLLVPLRSDTNIRYYEDNQLRKLLMVSTLLSHGYKISKIAELKEKELVSLIKELDVLNLESDKQVVSYTNQLIGYMISYDESGFEKVFSAILKRWGVLDAFIKVVYPFLSKTGILWSTVEISPLQEHFASSIIRKHILVAINNLPKVSKKASSFILFLPHGEWHELGLLLADFLIRSKGHKTIYLSQNVPLDELRDFVKEQKPDFLFTHLTIRKSGEKLHDIISSLLQASKTSQILIAGSEQILSEIKNNKRVYKLFTPDSLLERL